MINDIEKNKEIRENYNNSNNNPNSKVIIFNVTVISQGPWDIKIEYLDKIALPKSLFDISNDFEKYSS